LGVLSNALSLYLDFEFKVDLASQEIHAAKLVELESNLFILLNGKIDQNLEVTTAEFKSLLV
jgi:hypothetical protein